MQSWSSLFAPNLQKKLSFGIFEVQCFKNRNTAQVVVLPIPHFNVFEQINPHFFSLFERVPGEVVLWC